MPAQRKIVDITAEADRLHRFLTLMNKRRFSPALPTAAWRAALKESHDAQVIELAFLEGSRRKVADRAATAPRDAEGFLRWFEDLRVSGPGQNDPLFDYLAEAAPREAMRWFLEQEIAGEAGFDDLVALTQIRLPLRPKMELARNYWDEMGRGSMKGVHGGMLQQLARALDLSPSLDTSVWEALALANTMAGLAAHRGYAYHSVGALGAIELTAPGRSARVSQGLRRLGVRGDDRHYFDLHAVLDIKHSAAWNEEAIGPLVAADPAVAPAIAEGALMRLECGAQCFARYKIELGIAG